MENKLTTIEAITAKELTSYLDVMGLSATLTDKEKIQFLEISQAFGLNPFKREIYCSKYNNQTSIIVGYETYIKRAERSGQLDGWQVITEGKVEDNTLKAIITIYRKDRKFPFVHEVYYSEYVQKTRDGIVTKFWQKAFTMIKKVAMAQGFRLCFSDELGGIPYTKEEMPETEDIQHEEVLTVAPILTKTSKHIIDVITTPIVSLEEQLEDAKAILVVATMDTLNELYLSLPVNMQKNEEIIGYCKVLKQSFNK